MDEVTKHYLISGRVQGVGFRAFTQRTAAKLSLRGWVRNLLDGRVEAMAQGSGATLATFESQLREGPPHGRVDEVLVGMGAGEIPAASFEVRKDGSKPCGEI